ncbi:MAG: ABC transporter substrate-binding protein [Bacteroidetes bacterium]|nr:ABC transporter substrate-binding protein [Bacteroidota bacterium]
MSRLDLLQFLTGISNPELVYNPQVQQLLKKGEIVSLGGMELNYEKMLMLHPDFVFTSGDWDGGDRLKMKLESLQIKSVLNLDYMEQDPLARAEWLKFVAVFFDREYEADSIFKSIEASYLSLEDRMTKVVHRPTVICNMPFKEI